MRCLWIFIFMLLLSGVKIYGPAFAAEKEEAAANKVSPQQVGGLLFDVDEGVNIEQGPGGSVYLKSNREFMKNKLDQFESRIAALEAKVEKLESGKLTVPAGTEEPSGNSSKTRVLVN